MKFKALFLALVLTLSSMKFAYSEEFQPKVAVAYDIGFLGDNSFNDAVNGALSIAKKKYNLVEPFIREVPTNGTAVDRLPSCGRRWISEDKSIFSVRGLDPVDIGQQSCLWILYRKDRIAEPQVLISDSVYVAF